MPIDDKNVEDIIFNRINTAKGTELGRNNVSIMVDSPQPGVNRRDVQIEGFPGSPYTGKIQTIYKTRNLQKYFKGKNFLTVKFISPRRYEIAEEFFAQFGIVSRGLVENYDDLIEFVEGEAEVTLTADPEDLVWDGEIVVKVKQDLSFAPAVETAFWNGVVEQSVTGPLLFPYPVNPDLNNLLLYLDGVLQPNAYFTHNTTARTLTYNPTVSSGLHTVSVGSSDGIIYVVNPPRATLVEMLSPFKIPIDSNGNAYNSVVANCPKFRKLAPDLMQYCGKLKNMSLFFDNNPSLEEIPDGFLDPVPLLESCPSMLRDCSSLKRIPRNLLRYHANLKDISGMLIRAYALKDGILEINKSGVNISQLYFRCWKLEMDINEFQSVCAPARLPSGNLMQLFYEDAKMTGSGLPFIENVSTNTNHRQMLTNCTGLADYASIPADWK